uniref:Cytochrome P450 CYP71AT85 n=1 Tax=Plectranthus barbatus TaxID=41228 RepID=A0A1B0VRQ1_9LAMI|nr:cytochrome P450 CYP71AT85 [Plectranthus barbatus]
MIFLFMSLFLPITLIYFFHKTRKSIKTNVPPGPTPLPLIGNLHQLATAGELHVYLWKLSKKYGPIIHMKLGSTPLIVVSTARLAKEVLKTQDLAFCSRPKSLGLQKISYNNIDIIFAPYNDYWREVRKITSIHLFSLKKVQSFRPIREDEISKMITKIANSAASHEAVKLSEMTMALGSSLICRIAFGKSYDEDSSERRRFDELLHDAEEISVAFFASDYFPAFSWIDKLTGMIGKVNAIFEKLDSFYQELIDEHLDPSRVRTTSEQDDILDILIRLKQDQMFSSIDLTWDHIKALLMNIFIAGADTSAAAIVWTMTALIKSPAIMKILQEEIRNLIGQKGEVDEDDLPKLLYLKSVIKETFRLYPTAPLLIPRETTERCLVDGYEIQPKTVVYVNSWAASRDPECWENPNEFMPERFLNSSIDIKGQDFGVTPFGSGRRMCPGILMGLLNVELTLANLLYHFDWELPEGIRAEDVDTDAMPGLAVQKKNALVLVPTKYIF